MDFKPPAFMALRGLTASEIWANLGAILSTWIESNPRSAEFIVPTLLATEVMDPTSFSFCIAPASLPMDLVAFEASVKVFSFSDKLFRFLIAVDMVPFAFNSPRDSANS